jgi:hypothetical protein
MTAMTPVKTTEPTVRRPWDVALGVALVDVPVLETEVDVCSTEVLVDTEGEPVAVKMETSELGSVEATKVELPTMGMMTALVGIAEAAGVEPTSERLIVTEPGEPPTGMTVVPTGAAEVTGTTVGVVGTTTGVEARTTGAVVASVGGQ